LATLNLSWSELEELVLDVEIALNDRPLSYLEDDIQLRCSITPNFMLNLNPNDLPNLHESSQIPEI
jgi:hypothetical protein